jgi:ribosomal protein L11 methyltransferase
MNVRTDFPVVLVISSPEDSDAFREELIGVLADYPVVAIHEMDSDSTHWAVSFGETAWDQDSFDFRLQMGFPLEFTFPLDATWQQFPDRVELLAARAGRAVSDTFRERVHCALGAPPADGWSPTRFEESHGRVQVGRIVVAPPWIFPDLDGTTLIIKIRPSTGFGTGHHPSTRLALALLQKIECEGRHVLDVGTGSGVLAIAAARLGAIRVCAIDRDADALVAAADGLQRNALKQRVELKQADISVDTLGEFDVVVANLECDQIQAWGSSLWRHVKPGGQLLLSGFWTTECDEIARALPEPPSLVEYEGGWAAAIVKRPAEESSIRPARPDRL